MAMMMCMGTHISTGHTQVCVLYYISRTVVTHLLIVSVHHQYSSTVDRMGYLLSCNQPYDIELHWQSNCTNNFMHTILTPAYSTYTLYIKNPLLCSYVYSWLATV